MEHRQIPRLGRAVSCVGFGAWQLGADWGDVSEGDAIAALEAALAAGVTFIDTADVYGDGRSERIIGRVLASHPGERPFVATKMGRRVPQEHAELHAGQLPRVDRPLAREPRRRRGSTSCSCTARRPPVFEDDALFDALDALVEEGRIARLRRERRDVRPGARQRSRGRGVATVQIILNAFRLKPLERVLPAAARGGRRDHRARAARERAALRPLHQRDDVRGRRPPHATTATARRSTSARRSPASTTRPASRRSAGSRRSCPRARRWPSGRCASCSTSPASPS